MPQPLMVCDANEAARTIASGAMRWAVLVSVLSCLAACESPIPPAPEPEPEFGELSEHLCEPIARLVCGRAAACGCGAITSTGHLDVELCVERFRERCVARYAPDWVDAEIVVARRRTRELVDRLEATHSCDRLDLDWSPRAGGLAFYPVEIDEPCPVTFEASCAEGAGMCVRGMCRPAPIPRAPCPGCTPRVPDGGACLETDECDAGLRCDAGTCVPASRRDCSECASGEACSPTAARCRPRLGEGEPCLGGGCAEGLECYARVCVPKLELGDPCSSWSSGALECAAGLYCGPSDGREECVARLGEGEPCVDGGAPCLEGLVCRSGTCTSTLPGLGESCADAPCAPPLGCSGPALCSDETEWRSCLSQSECEDHLVCVDEHCVPPVEDGAACSSEVRCRGACTRDASGIRTCVPAPGAEGDPCDGHADCSDDLYCAPRELCAAGACGDLL